MLSKIKFQISENQQGQAERLFPMFDLGVGNNMCADQLYSFTQLQCITGQHILPGSPSAMHTLCSDQTKSKQEWEIV